MSVVEQLAAKLDVTAEEAERALDQYIDETQQKLRSDQRVELPGIGVFEQDSTGTVAFTPEPSLEAVANHRFEGLSTLELPSPEQSSKSNAAEPLHPQINDEEDLPTAEVEAAERGDDSALEVSDTADRNVEETRTLDEEIEQFWDETSTESPLGPTPGYEDASYSVVDKESTTDDDDSTEESSTPEPSPARSPEEPSRQRTTSGATFSRSSRSSDSGSRKKLRVVAGLLIVTGAVLLLYFAWFRGSARPPGSPAENSEQTVSAPATASDDNNNAQDQAASSPTTDESPSSENGTSDEPLPFESPLRSAEGIQPPHGGYAWIVASVEDRATAEQLRDTYAADGFRTSILEGGRGYRVAVGQFETVEDVLATRSELPSEISSEAWVLAIQSNM